MRCLILLRAIRVNRSVSSLSCRPFHKTPGVLRKRVQQQARGHASRGPRPDSTFCRVIFSGKNRAFIGSVINDRLA